MLFYNIPSLCREKATLHKPNNAETGTEEDKTLQDLVEQGLSLMKGSDDENNEQEVFQKCLGLLDSVTKEIHSESGGAEDPMGAMNPLMQQLSKAMGDVAQGYVWYHWQQHRNRENYTLSSTILPVFPTAHTTATTHPPQSEGRHRRGR